MDPVLEIRDAAKRFGDIAALDGADLVLHRGEWLGLLGPNGAGKSTLVRAISGRVRLDRGDVTLLGAPLGAREGGARTPSDDRAKDRAKLGIVPQELALYDRLTARENLETFGALSGVPRAVLRQRVERALEWTGLLDRARDQVRTYSGGMMRRLNLACGILHEPEVLILDEPTVGVDPQSRERIWQVLKDLHGRGTSIVLTTHQLDEAESTCERIVILDHGKVIAEGSVAELVERTVGPNKRLVLTLAAPLDEALGVSGLERLEPTKWTATLSDVAKDLPRLLAAVDRAGGKVADVSLEKPTLQAVFLKLTGRELRD